MSRCSKRSADNDHDAIVAAVEAHVDDLTAHSFYYSTCLFIQSFTPVSARCRVMTVITRAVEAHVENMSPRHLASVLWSFAKLGT